jgi:peptidoglycan hydrolase-like protein with peptidoglycan-binding domain
MSSAAARGIRIVVSLMAAMAVFAGAAGAQQEAGAPAGATAAVLGDEVKLLRMGDRGAAVRALQKRLRISADGVFGRGTRRALKRFQRRRGLHADGIAGPATLRALGLARIASTPSAPVRLPAALERIADCESGGNPAAISPDGKYRGKYQFSRATWRALGGKGDPAKASEAEQDRRALDLYKRDGSAPWPSCA